MINFDSEPRLYLAICNLLLVASAFLSFYPLLKGHSEKLRFFHYLFLWLIITTFIAFRLPVVVYNDALNPDESMFIVGAMTLAQNPVYWESVDGCTSGPFSFYAITAFCELFRQPYDYVSARIVGLTMMISNLILNFFTLRKFFTVLPAAISIFAVAAFLATTQHPDFVHFSSEHLPIFLLSLMSFGYACLVSNPVLKKSHLFWLGILAGMIPFAKLQATPIAASLSLIIYWLIYQRKKNRALPYFGIFTLGGIFIPALLFASGAYFGFLDEVWVYYIQHNLNYGSQVSVINSIFLSLTESGNIFIKILAILAIGLSGYLVLYKKQLMPAPKSVFIIAFLGSSIFAVFKPGFLFPHYLLFLVFPGAFLLAYVVDELLALSNIYLKKITLAASMLVILGFTLVMPAKNRYVTNQNTSRPIAISPISEEILKYSHPDEPLSIWGESGKYYLATRRLQGIRWSHTYWGMYSDSLQNLFKQEYVKELKARLTPVFIDTHVNIGSFMSRNTCGYETVPELKKLIDTQYKLIAEIDQQRIFVRNDRIAELNGNKEVSELKTNDGAE